FYAFPVGASSDPIDPMEGPMVARFSGNRVSFDSETTGEAVHAALNHLERTKPGTQVYIGSGTHGDEYGNNAQTCSALRDKNFLYTAQATASPSNFSALGPVTVMDVGKRVGARNFEGAQKTADKAPP